MQVRLTALTLSFAFAAASPAAAKAIDVQATGVAFLPAKVSAHVGDIIQWDNKDFVAHTATARAGGWDIALPPHKSGKLQLKKPGKLEYYCRYHPNMKGEIDVK